MTYFAAFCPKRIQWRVFADYREDGGALVDVCGALSATIAMHTVEYLRQMGAINGNRSPALA